MKHANHNTLVQIVYREASSEEERRAREHLAACASCCEYFENVQRISARLAQWSEERPLPDTLARIMVNLPQTQPRVRVAQPAYSVKPIFGIALALLGILLVLYFMQSNINALPLWSAYEQHWLVQTLGSYGVAVLLFLGVGVFFTLAFAPVLYFDAHRKSLYV